MQRKERVAPAEKKAAFFEDVIAAGYAADEWAHAMFSDGAGRGSFPEHWLKEAIKVTEPLAFSDDELKSILSPLPEYSLWPAGENGIYGALWWLTGFSSVGGHVYVDKIPLRQQTTELAEILDTDPYRAKSKGMYLISTAAGAYAEELLLNAGIPARIIGCTIPGKEKLLINGDTRQYLTKD